MRPPNPDVARGGRSLVVVLALTVTLGMLAVSLVAQPAAAAHKSKKKPHRVTVTAIAADSFTVQARARGAKTWQVFAATTKREVSLPRVRSARSSAVSRGPQVTLRGLRPSSEPYFYRVAASDGHKTRYSTIRAVYLRPAVPSAVAAGTPPGGGLAVTWDESGPAASFTVEQATDPAFTQGLRSYIVKGMAHELTPYGMDPGQEYWFRVRAANGSVASAYSDQVSAVAPAAGVPLRVLTYNLLWAPAVTVGAYPVSPWSKRRVAAAKLVHGAQPDVILVQEGNSGVGGTHERQVDSFRDALRDQGDEYAVADTEPAGERTGPYVLYRPDRYTAVGTGGRWALGDGRFAAYQLLRHVTGAELVAVSVHLTSGKGSAKDAARRLETKTLLERLNAYALQVDAAVVVGGDFNAHAGKNYSFDPSAALATEHIPDSVEVATTLVNEKYNSANKYEPKALTGSFNIDHIYAPPGIAVRKWSMLLNVDKQDRFEGTIPSDHNPLVADLEIPAARSPY